MIVFRRRLIYWLIREYIKKWGKTILLSFAIGLAVFFALISSSQYFLPRIPALGNESIGVVGAYALDNLPDFITRDMSIGLTQVSQNGELKPGIALRWKIENDGKRYTFYIRQDAKFNDGLKVTSDLVQYKFSDVSMKRPDQSTVVFDLKESYSPFLITVSHPIFKKGVIGTGVYKIKHIDLNGNFVQTLVLSSVKYPYKTKTYQFYPSDASLKTAYVLGEVSNATGLHDVSYLNTTLENFSNTKVKKTVNYKQLITLFYNTQDRILSDKRVRSALSYVLPDAFSQGERTYMPYSPKLWAYTNAYNFTQDIDRAKILLSTTEVGTKSASIKLEIKTLPKYKKTAEAIAKEWKKIDVETNIDIVESTPSRFQIFLGNFFLPLDPDQYTLWHSDQSNNITQYQNQRIDKLLEDGRKTIDIIARKKIYTDFQKYLTTDSPASFLYFPYEYEISRK